MNARNAVRFALLILISGQVMADSADARKTTATPATQKKIKRFVQKDFVIGLWNDPPADSKMDARYKQIADANFTLVFGGSDVGAVTVEKAKKMYRLCKKYGLKGIAPDCISKDPTYYKNWQGDEFMGVNIKDEPNAEYFDWVAKRTNVLREKIPGKLPFVNLYPNYCLTKQLKAKSYEDYISSFMKKVNPDVLCMDHYPTMRPDCDGREDYCKNLAVMKKYSQKYSIPFWNCFLSIPYGAHYSPTEYNLRWQINTSLIYGAKGVIWFTYYTPPANVESSIFRKGGALVRRDGSLTRLYYQARRINKELKNIGPVLMKLTSKKIYHLKPYVYPPAVLKNCPVKNISKSWKGDLPFNVMLGTFKHEDGRRAVMINNYDMHYGCWLTVEFDVDPAKVLEVDRMTGNIRKVIDDSPAMKGLQVSLDAADSRLFILPEKTNAK